MNYTQVKIASTIPYELYTGVNHLHLTPWIIHRWKSPAPYPMNYTLVKIIRYELYTGVNHLHLTPWIIHRCKSPAPYLMNYTQVKIPEPYTGENHQHHTLWIIHRCKSPSPYSMNYTQVKIASTIPNELYTGENPLHCTRSLYEYQTFNYDNQYLKWAKCALIITSIILLHNHACE